MLNPNWLVPLMLTLIALSLGIRLLLRLYYRDGERILPKLRLAAGDRRISYYKRFDSALAPLAFIYCWCDIIAAVLFFRLSDYGVLAGILLAVVAAGRLRALQELGHNALHLALCRSRGWQWFLSNVFFQFPALKRDMDSRFNTHVRDHHPNADVPGKDPNLKRVIAAGMTPGISNGQFVLALLYPVSPKGIFNNIKGNLHDVAYENASWRIVLLRVLVTAAVMALFVWTGGLPALAVGWLVPVLALYPLFAWWSLLTKHRWHTPYTPLNRDRLAHDYEHGRATDFTGLPGMLQRYLIFPMSDAYHLAHHVYPFVRYHYLPAVDRALKIHEPRYTQYISQGMFFANDGQPAALSELRDRLVSAPPVRATE